MADLGRMVNYIFNPEMAARDAVDYQTSNAQKAAEQEAAKRKADQELYMNEYYDTISKAYDEAFNKQRQLVAEQNTGLYNQRAADYTGELGRMGLSNTVAGSLLKNKLAQQNMQSIIQTLANLDANRLQQLAQQKVNAFKYGYNRASSEAAQRAAAEAQRQQELMSIPASIMSMFGEQVGQAKGMAKNYLTGGMSGASGGSGGQGYAQYNQYGEFSGYGNAPTMTNEEAMNKYNEYHL